VGWFAAGWTSSTLTLPVAIVSGCIQPRERDESVWCRRRMYAVACIVVYEQARPGSLRGAFLDWARLLATQLSFSSGESN
jgi:hypothetical protein